MRPIAPRSAIVDAFPRSMTRRRDLRAAARAALTEAFVNGESFTYTALCARFAEPSDGNSISTSGYLAFRRLEKDGLLLLQENPSAGKFSSPFAFDFSGQRRFTPGLSLANAVEWAIAARSVPLHALRSALRALLALPIKAPDVAIIRQCERFPVESLHGFGTFVRDSLRERSAFTGKTISNHTAAIKRLLRVSVTRGVIPGWFPRFIERDAWEGLIDSHFPLAAEGPTPTRVRKIRSGLRALRTAARGLGYVGDPESLTEDQVIAAVRSVSSAANPKAFEALRHLRQILRRSRFTGAVSRIAAALESTTRPSGEMYLRSSEPHFDHGSWPAMSQLCREFGMLPEWEEFVGWYDHWTTSDWRTLRSNREVFPPRPPIRELTRDTLHRRSLALRAWLWAASTLPGVTLRTLTLADAFGGRFEDIAHVLLDRWESRAANDTDRVSHRASMGLHHIIVSAGLFANALFERKRFARGSRSDTDAATFRMTPGWITATELQPLAPDERLLLEGYRLSTIYAKNLQHERAASELGCRTNTVRDVRVIIRETPHTALIAAHQRLLTRVQQKHDRDLRSLSFHRLVLGTYVSGLLLPRVSAATRICICSVRAAAVHRLKTKPTGPGSAAVTAWRACLTLLEAPP